MTQARLLFEQGRFADALELATAPAPADPGYASGRLVAVWVLLEQARFAELSDLLTGVPDGVLVRDEDGRVLDLWRSYLRALELPTDRGDVVTEAADRFAATARDGPTERLRVEASALVARTTRLRVAYAELPHTANAEAAEEFGRAAEGYRRLGLTTEADTAALLRCRALRALPDEPTGPLTAALDEVAAAARARGDAFSEASARLEALEVRTVAALREPPPWSLDGVLAECSAVGESLDAAGHAFGPARAEWTVLAPLLQYGVEEAVGPARGCAEVFDRAGARHRAHDVWRALFQFHAYRGERAAQREAGQRATATAGAGGRWQHFEVLETVAAVERLFRIGQLDQARTTVDAGLAAAPHRHARVALRVQLATQLIALGQDVAARALLRTAHDDLTPVAPAALSGEVLNLLSWSVADSDEDAALAYAEQAADAARATGDLPSAGRYLAGRAQLRTQLRHTAGHRPAFTADAAADLDRATALLEPLHTVDAQRALVAVHQARGQSAFFDGDAAGAFPAFAAAEELARAAGLRPDLAFVLSYAGMAGTQYARDHADPDVFGTVADVLREAHGLFLDTELTQIAWRPRFMAANADWEASRIDPDPASASERLQRAETGLEDTATDLDILRGTAGGGDAVARQLTGIGFGVDKQQVYRAGFHLAVDGRRDTARAVRWLERMKSRALLDAVAAAAVPTPPEGDATAAELLDRERRLRAAHAAADGYADLVARQRELDAVLDRMATHPTTAGYATLRRSAPAQWPQVRDGLRAHQDRTGRRLVVAQYYCDADNAMLFVMAADLPRPMLVRNPVPMPDLAAFVAPTFRSTGGVLALAQAGTDTWQRFAPLVAPLADQADPDDVICLVPHRTLHDLPLHTLPVDGVPLGLRNPVCYAPSLTLLLNVLGREPTGASGTAVFGDPGGDLPSARREAWTVAATLGAGEPRLGAEVTRGAVLAALGSAATVHFAGHAAASTTDGMAAGVELADGDLLRARDLLLAPIRSGLVVLSGCETGVSEQRPGDEGVGLVRALLHGGAGALLTSQWQVPDGSARRLLTAFHTHHTGMSRADALRRAMQDAAARPGREHFHHWGAFVLVGDWR